MSGERRRQGNGKEKVNMFSYVLTSLPGLKQIYKCIIYIQNLNSLKNNNNSSR